MSSVGPRTGSPLPVPIVLRRKSAISIYRLRSGHRDREVMFGLISSLALARTLMSASLAKWLPLGPCRSESNIFNFSFNECRACFAASNRRTPRYTSALVLEYVSHTANCPPHRRVFRVRLAKTFHQSLAHPSCLMSGVLLNMWIDSWMIVRQLVNIVYH